MSNLSEKLLQHKAAAAADSIGDGKMTAAEFENFWRDGGEAVALAELHREGMTDDPPVEKKVSEMTPDEKVAYRNQHGNEAFCRKIQKG